MSEKQARIKRKSEPQQETKKKKGSIWGNVIVTVVVIAFLGLGYYAIKDKLPKPPEKPVTVAKLAKEKDMSVEDFIAEYELDASQVNKDTTEADFENMLSVANYAKYNGQTTDEWLTENGIKITDENSKDGKFDETMLWSDAMQYETMGHLVKRQNEETGEEKTFEEFMQENGIPEELLTVITEDTTIKDAQAVLSELAAAQEQARNEEGSEEGGETAEETAENAPEAETETETETETEGE